jgi:hypothetical protein
VVRAVHPGGAGALDLRVAASANKVEGGRRRLQRPGRPGHGLRGHYGSLYPSIVDPGGVIANSYGVTSPPTTFVINRQGRVAATLLGREPPSWRPSWRGSRREVAASFWLWARVPLRRRGGAGRPRRVRRRAGPHRHLETLVKCPACDDLSVAQSNATSAIAVRHDIARDVHRGGVRQQDPDLARGDLRHLDPAQPVDVRAGSAALWLVPVGGGGTGRGGCATGETAMNRDAAQLRDEIRLREASLPTPDANATPVNSVRSSSTTIERREQRGDRAQRARGELDALATRRHRRHEGAAPARWLVVAASASPSALVYAALGLDSRRVRRATPVTVRSPHASQQIEQLLTRPRPTSPTTATPPRSAPTSRSWARSEERHRR